MAASPSPLERALGQLEATLDQHLDDLAALVRIGGLRAGAAPHPPTARRVDRGRDRGLR